MKSKKILAALVLGSIMQMCVAYAENYDGVSDGDYVQGTNIKFDKMDVTSTRDPQDIHIGNKDGSTNSITIGDANNTSTDYALTVNDPNKPFSVGGNSEQIIHNVTLNATDITVVGGRGILLGSREGEDASSLTIKGKTFTVDAKSNDAYGGLDVGAFATLKIGDKDNQLDKVAIKGGRAFSISPTGQNLGGIKDRYAEINAKDVLFDSTEANKSNGTAFSNSKSTVVVNADTITVIGKKTEFNKSGVLNVHGSKTDFNAKNINIVANKEKSNEKYKNQLYAIKADDGLPGPNTETYTLNLTATEKLNINGNVLLDKYGTTNMVGKDIVITGTNVDTNDYEGNRGSAINLWGQSKLNIGTEKEKAGSVIISSAGKFGILIGRDNNSKDSNYAAKLNSNVDDLFSITANAENGCGISIQDDGYADIKAGGLVVEASTIGLDLNKCSMDVQTDQGINISSGGIGINAVGMGPTDSLNLNLNATNGDIYLGGQKTTIFVKDHYTVDLKADNGNINIIAKEKSSSSGSEKAAIYTEAYDGISGLETKVNLSAENGVVNIQAVDKAVWANAKDGAINIDGAVNIVTKTNEDEKDFALLANGDININLKGTKDSYIGNDIIAKNNGQIEINSKDYSGRLIVDGDIMAEKELFSKGQAGVVNVDFGENGVFTGKTDNGGILTKGTINLSFDEGSIWNLTGDSCMDKITTNNSVIDMTADSNAFSELKVKEITGTGGTIHMDIDASANANNSDCIYVNGTHEGVHYITLENIGANTDGAEGTVLVSVKDEKGEFKANDSEGTLYWNTYELGRYDADKGDTVTEDYGTDWYLKKAEKVNKPTTGVDSVLSMNSLNYHTWRTENDKLLQRMGELRHNGEEAKGAWFRVKGSKIGYDGGFENKYTTYELGYDEVVKRTENMVRYQGAALSYVDGSSSYNSGSGDNHGKSIGFYSTDQYSKGHYLDIVFKVSNLDNDFDVFDTNGNKITGEYDNTGVSISAEYGRKNDLANGWYIEPQAQLTLGYMGGASYETSNGISVDQSGIKSVLGRIGFNIGKQIGEKGIVYAKANLLHEFGGGYDVEMRAADGSLTVSNTYNDTWFEYGLGVAFATSDNSHVYFDVERSAGSDFYKDWQWNAGVRYSF